MITGAAVRLRRFFSVEHRTIGAAALRMTLGLNTLVMYALHFPQRAFIWGDEGVFPRDVNATFLTLRHSTSLYNIGTSDGLHAIIFFAGMAVTVLFTVGVSTRLTSILFFVFTFSLYTRNEIVLDGGDNLLILVAFWLMFVDVSGKRTPARNRSTVTDNAFVSLLHNFAIIAIIGQICILYFTSAWAKMMGHEWQDGTAIYYILRTTEFNLSPLTHVIIFNPFIVAVLVYGTIVLQVGFPFVIWHKVLKYPWILGAFSFHIAIAYFMGLVWFSLTMLSCELVLIDDRVYLTIGRHARLWLGKGLRRVTQARYGRVPIALGQGAVVPPL